MDYYNDNAGLEDWEDDNILFEKEDWVRLLNLRHQRAKKQPSDLYAQQRYAEALILNKMYKEAIDFLNPLYQENHESGFGINEIIDALFGLGKTENDFAWIEKPTVLKLDKKTFDICVNFLKGKRKHISLLKVYEYLLFQADYLAFNEDKLSGFLVKDNKTFDFKGDKKIFWDIDIKLNKIDKDK